MTDRVALSPNEAAEALSVSRQTMYRLMAAGEVPYLRVGRVRRIRVADLEAFAARQVEALDPKIRRTRA